MLPKWHVLLGLIFCVVLWFFGFPLYALAIIWIFSVGVDVDHYIIYVVTKKDWSLPRAYRFFKTMTRPEHHFCFFHTIEFIIILGFLAFLNKLFYFVFLGIAFHFITDLVTMLAARQKKPIIFFSAIARLVHSKRKY